MSQDNENEHSTGLAGPAEDQGPRNLSQERPPGEHNSPPGAMGPGADPRISDCQDVSQGPGATPPPPGLETPTGSAPCEEGPCSKALEPPPEQPEPPPASLRDPVEGSQTPGDVSTPKKSSETPPPAVSWQERARAKRVEAALERRRERLARVEGERTHMIEAGVRITGGDRVEDCDTGDDVMPPLLIPEFEALPEPEEAPVEPWVPAEEARQLALSDKAQNPGPVMARTHLHTVTPEDVENFLHYYARTGLFSQSAFSIGRTTAAMKAFEKENPAFSQLVAEAYQVYRERIAFEIHTRAVDGVVEPVFGKEGQIGWIRKYSDRLLELQARAVWPDRYGEQKTSVLPSDIKFGVLVVPAIVDNADEWEKLHGQDACGLPEPIEPSNPGPRITQPATIPGPKVTRPVGPRSGGSPNR